MKPGSMVWYSSYGRVRRVKLIAVDGEAAFVREDESHFTTSAGALFDSKAKATAAAIVHRSKELKEKVKRLNDLHQEVQKLMAEIVESLEVPGE